MLPGKQSGRGMEINPLTSHLIKLYFFASHEIPPGHQLVWGRGSCSTKALAWRLSTGIEFFLQVCYFKPKIEVIELRDLLGFKCHRRTKTVLGVWLG